MKPTYWLCFGLFNLGLAIASEIAFGFWAGVMLIAMGPLATAFIAGGYIGELTK